MRITHLRLSNWRNFKSVDIDLADRLFIYGPNASGKSNLLDAIRFLRDLTLDGGGFQQAVRDRGGMRRVRNLAARNFNHGRVTLAVFLGSDKRPRQWHYELTFSAERAGKHRPVVVEEIVWSDNRDEPVLRRPSPEDRDDPERLTQTALEQVVANKDFRDVTEFLASVRYLHLVPQVWATRDSGSMRSSCSSRAGRARPPAWPRRWSMSSRGSTTGSPSTRHWLAT